MRRKKRECRLMYCHEEPYLGGLCIRHHEEDHRKSMLRNAALDALHTGLIDGQLSEDLELREELVRIRRWWSKACDAVNYQRQDPVLLDEAPYAV
jgi:hypothetical protein